MKTLVRWTTVCLFVLSAASLFGQSTTGTIAGTVTDPSGSAIPGATVTITNLDQNRIIRQLTTEASGDYSAPLLPIGRYSLAVEAKGFKKSVQSEIVLNVNDKLTVNVPLQVGEVSQEVTVQESAVRVETQSAAQNTLVTGNQIRELSLNNRNFVQLMTLMPGVSNGSSDQIYVGVSNPSGESNTINYSINGARNSANNWMVDGADVEDRGSNLTLINYPSVDALSEFKIERSTYSAEFGRVGGGQVNVVTKSGTSAFHGDAYEFVRNNAFAANNTINNYNRVNVGPDSKAQVPPLHYNDFGWTLGGPIFVPGVYNRDKNKTFFFVSQEFRRVITYNTLQAFAPTDAEKQGIFPNPICVQYTNGACSQTATRITNVSPTAQAYLTDIFNRTPSGRAADNQLFSAAKNIFNFEQELYRLDQVINSKNTVFIRYLRDFIPTVEPYGLFGPQSGLPGVGTTSTNSPGHNWVARLDTTLTPTWVSQLGASYSYGAIISDPVGLAGSAVSPDVHPTLPFVSAVPRIPGLAFLNVSNSGVNSYGPYRDFNRNYQLFDNMTSIFGPHTLRYGGTWYSYQKTENAGGNNGLFTFTLPGPLVAGSTVYQQEFANFLLGQAGQFTQPSQDLKPDIRSISWETYLQDDWRAKPNFTLNVGLRYSYFGQPWDHRRELTNFNGGFYFPSQAPQLAATGNKIPGTGNPLNGILIQDQNSPYGNKVSNQQQLLFAPRVGFAWDPFNNGKTSIRSGYGIFYDTILYGVYEQNIFANPPYVSSVTILNTSLDNPLAGIPSVSASPLALHATPQVYQTPYTQQWSFDIQRELATNLMLDVAYVGTKGTHLPGIVDLNEAYPGVAYAAGLIPAGRRFTSSTENVINLVRPYQGYNAINSIETWFNSNYNALQVYAVKRFSGESQISVSYTWSKNMTDNRSDRSSASQNTYNFHEGEYGRAQFDRKHIFTANYVYDLPLFRNQHGIVGHVLGGWEVSGIVNIMSGLPYNVTSGLGTDPAGLGFLGASSAGPRPDWACNPNVNAPHTYLQWFNTSCFSDVPAGLIRPGNAGRSILNGPGLIRFDFSLFKNFAIWERVNLQLRGEAFNVFNHPNPDTFNTTYGSNAFGQISAFRDPRIIQIAAKLNF